MLQNRQVLRSMSFACRVFIFTKVDVQDSIALRTLVFPLDKYYKSDYNSL